MTQKTSLIDIDCIMPAAGLSSRMGEWKLMLPYNNTTILENSVKNALSVCSRVILVVGYRADELIEKMRTYENVKIVINENYQQGMFSSIQRGVEHVSGEHFFISHADMPCINPEIYHNLWQARSQGTVFPGDKKYSGHPVLIHSGLRKTILNAPYNGKMKAILNEFSVSYLQLTDPNIYFDIDTPDAYQALLKKQNV
ncbi:molybdenum cofactor cytidylyltransferase [Psychromonas sp. KJ10-10]|uniref:molybdenum cofactor cytidylyltransferase n=1 Tax=Psychromonas sp. KJ10-10 TaxID=3391823 RepID=UPI0039B5D238